MPVAAEGRSGGDCVNPSSSGFVLGKVPRELSFGKATLLKSS